LPGGIFGSDATAVSADGGVVVGIASVDSGVPQYPRGLEAFRWENGVMTGIGRLPDTNYSRAYGVSADGQVIVGDAASFSGIGRSEAFRWENGIMIGLGFLRSSGTRYSGASAISADGRVVVGSANVEEKIPALAFRWQDGQMIGLEPEPGGRLFTNPMAVSGDGSVIVGWGEGGAYIWDTQSGTRQLGDALRDEYGITFDSWQLLQATGVSADGKTIVGYGRNPNGDFEGWVANIPEPSTFLLAAIGASILAMRNRRQ
jgi:probable HAF family extracellular repeat protein